MKKSKLFSINHVLLTIFAYFYGMPVVARGADAANLSPKDAIGQIAKPPGTDVRLGPNSANNENQLLPFISDLIAVAALVAGIWVLINIFLAAYTAILSNGDAQAMQKVRNNITNSIIGLLLIVLAYTIAALAGAILFGDSKLFTDPSF